MKGRLALEVRMLHGLIVKYNLHGRLFSFPIPVIDASANQQLLSYSILILGRMLSLWGLTAPR